MSKERDHGSGRYVEKATLDDVLAAFDAVDAPPVVTTADVADATGVSRDSARRKLETLRENGRVDRRQTAGRVILYWPADEPTPSERRETGETPVQSDRGDTTATDADRTGPTNTGRDESRTGERTDTVDAAHDSLPSRLAILTADLGRDELAGSGDKLADRVEAFQTVVAYLVEYGTAEPKDLKQEVYPDHSAHYDTPRSWWKNAMYPALAELADHADEIATADTTGEWVYSPGA